MDTDEHEPSALKSSQVRVEMLNAEGAVVASSLVPVNVDCPQQFCGTALVGTIIATLDERIAFEGCGTFQTYRQQQDFLERHGSRDPLPKGTLEVLTHQADLDRFFRNLQIGFRGVRARLKAMPNSEFTLRRTVKDLVRWCQETLTDESERLSIECRLFLVDRLARQLKRRWRQAREGRKFFFSPQPRDSQEFQVSETLQSASEWMDGFVMTVSALTLRTRLDSWPHWRN